MPVCSPRVYVNLQISERLCFVCNHECGHCVLQIEGITDEEATVSDYADEPNEEGTSGDSDSG